MKKGKLEHWTNIEQCNNLLLFSELVEELLFDYSIPSNRISTLNSHYLCFDALSTINTIENNGVPEGTLKPIVEELYRSLDNDAVFKLCGENPIRFFVKPQNGKYCYTKVNDLGYDDMKKIVISLYEKYFQDDWYITSHIENIKKIIIDNNANEIYEKLHYYFYNTKKAVSSSLLINDFLGIFNFKKINILFC